MSDKSQNYISRVHFKGYKSIKDLELDLKPGLNIIIGPNGSGKTNFLEFLFKARREHFINSPMFSSIQIKQVDGKDVAYDWISEKSNEEGVRFIYTKREVREGKETFMSKWRIFEDKNKLEAPFEQKGSNTNSISFWLVPTLIKFGVPETFNESISHPNKLLIDFHEGLLRLPWIENLNDAQSLFLNIIGLELIGKSYDTSSNDSIIDKINFTQLNTSLKSYSPIEEVRFDTKRALNYFDEPSKSLVIDNLVLQFFVAGKWLFWNQLSDGTKRLFFIISEINYGARFILLEEPELGIHPDQLYKIMDFLKEQSKEKQIILTTHSPEVLNALDKDELDRIIVTRYDPEKGTQMHHLSEEHIKKAQGYMKNVGFISDFWVHSNLEEYEAAEG